jgi:hypothetical protein
MAFDSQPCLPPEALWSRRSFDRFKHPQCTDHGANQGGSEIFHVRWKKASDERVRSVELVRDRLGSKQTTIRTGERRELSKKFRRYIIHRRVRVAARGKQRLTSANPPVSLYSINKPQHRRRAYLIVVELPSHSARGTRPSGLFWGWATGHEPREMQNANFYSFCQSARLLHNTVPLPVETSRIGGSAFRALMVSLVLQNIALQERQERVGLGRSGSDVAASAGRMVEGVETGCLVVLGELRWEVGGEGGGLGRNGSRELFYGTNVVIGNLCRGGDKTASGFWD